ncbi:DUF5700 domain-containing putative Zn-dependent protease [Anaeromicropila herbilytica]|uniref:DUF2268 domain-containing protein n=1 Tax=Anaeromicropila herbilytica TaxID=2785025 RepID=A0A7R7ELI6_9FIRM|nr:DUF5700 domain-containing putative Zn-dependent protease [Anaeromicropila herbilytica]BCN30987.1 hypothetical protein bsdtb5_22820 [Anaeromicropila herbilytica]
MRIYNDIVRDYIEGNSLEHHKKLWFFQSQRYKFVEPSYEHEHIDSVKRIYENIMNTIENFVPCNSEIWDALFPNWEKIIEEVTVNLIVGFPEPNDATVLKAPDGTNNVILDLGLWTKYESKCNIASVVHNLLTHELCHICIGESIKGIDNDIESNDYLTNLDANTFHEGFAHLISFDNKEIDEVDWDNEKWKIVKDKSRIKMQSAICAIDSIKQKEYLYDAVFGNYEDKYACMSGMFYLVNCWKRIGILGLQEEFNKGYHGFSKRTIADPNGNEIGLIQQNNEDKVYQGIL